MVRYAIGNWKMDPPTRREAELLFSSLAQELGAQQAKGVEVVVCPPFIWLPLIAEYAESGTGYALGAQNVFHEKKGAHTGEVSLAMLKSMGVSYVIVGHSERRALYETNAIVAAKLKLVLEAGLKAVLCVGEKERVGDWHEFLKEEVEEALAVVDPGELEHLIIAYEPIWAIGGSETDTPDDALGMAVFIRKLMQERFGERGGSVPVLYGGSIEADNVAPFALQEGIDGVLVGHASRDAGQFARIVRTMAGEA